MININVKLILKWLSALVNQPELNVTRNMIGRYERHAELPCKAVIEQPHTSRRSRGFLSTISLLINQVYMNTIGECPWLDLRPVESRRSMVSRYPAMDISIGEAQWQQATPFESKHVRDTGLTILYEPPKGVEPILEWVKCLSEFRPILLLMSQHCFCSRTTGPSEKDMDMRS